MKHILIILLFFSFYSHSNLFSKNIKLSSKEKKAIAIGLKRKKYEVLDQFFKPEELYPAIYITHKFVVEDINSNDSFMTITNQISFQKTGAVIAYTNKWGVFFVNDKEYLFTPDEFTNTLVKQSTLFKPLQQISKRIFEAKKAQELRGIIQEISHAEDVYILIASVFALQNSHLRINKNDSLISTYTVLTTDPLRHYINQKILPKSSQSLEKQRLFWLNYLVFYLFYTSFYVDKVSDQLYPKFYLLKEIENSEYDSYLSDLVP
ncbi:MAG: hypothetical protein ACRCTJ_02275 [Brevinema sp.]